MEMQNCMLLMIERMLTRQEEAAARQEKAEADAKARQEKVEAHVKARHEEAAARQEKATAELKAAHAEMKAAQAEMEAMGEARQEKMKADINASIEVIQEKRIAELKAAILASFRGTTIYQTETTSCSEEMEATNLEATSEATEAAVERQDLFNEELNAENIGSSEDRSGYRRLFVRRRRGAKKRTQDSVGSRQKSSAARKRVIRRAIPAVRKGHIYFISFHLFNIQ
jgi:membrane protein involved in colicin uptake